MINNPNHVDPNGRPIFGPLGFEFFDSRGGHWTSGPGGQDPVARVRAKQRRKNVVNWIVRHLVYLATIIFVCHVLRFFAIQFHNSLHR